jgi:hypothetical protein
MGAGRAAGHKSIFAAMMPPYAHLIFAGQEEMQ